MYFIHPNTEYVPRLLTELNYDIYLKLMQNTD
jgi:hypothetical protein